MKFFYQSAMKAYNRTKLMRNLTVIEVGLQLALLAIFFRHGIEMVALTQVIAAIIICIAHAWYYKRLWNLLSGKCSANLYTLPTSPQ